MDGLSAAVIKLLDYGLLGILLVLLGFHCKRLQDRLDQITEARIAEQSKSTALLTEANLTMKEAAEAQREAADASRIVAETNKTMAERFQSLTQAVLDAPRRR